MNFTEMIKGDLKEKYSNMLNGKTARQNNDVVIKDSGDFLSNYKTLADRLKREIKEINDGLARINGDKSSRIKAENDERDREENARREAERAARAKRDAIETFFQAIALASPIIMCIIFAIILFSNKEQISIVSNFTGWCTGWVFFTIASLITSIVLLKKRFGDWSVDDGASRAGSTIVTIIMIICSIIVFSNSGKLSSNFDPTTFITFNVTGKTTSTSYSTYYSTISFSLKNNSNVEVTYICGEMKLYNGSTQVGSWNVYFNGEYQGGQSYTTTVKLDESNKSDLYNTSYTNLGVTYRITSMKFNGDYKEHEYNGQTMTLKAIGDTSGYENNYKEAVSLYNQGKYSEAQVIFESLGEYKDSAWYADQCENKAFYQEMETHLHDVAGSNAILPDNYTLYLAYNYNDYFYYNHTEYRAFFCDFRISASEESSYISKFKTKLISNGFTAMDNNTYKKGSTMIYISDIQEGYTDNYINYYAWKIN